MKIYILPREGKLCSLGNYVLIGQRSENQQMKNLYVLFITILVLSEYSSLRR